MQFIEKIKNIGVSEDMSEADKLMVQTINRLTAYYYFFSFISTIINAQFLTYTKLIPVIVIFQFYLLSFVFTFLKFFETARYNIWVVTMLVIFWMSSAFGYESNSHLLFYVMILTTVTSFEFKSMKLLGFVVSIPIILLIILYLTHFSLFHIEGVSDKVLNIIGTNFVFITAMSIALSALQYKKEFENRTKMITNSEEKLKLKIIELEKTNEELDSFVYRVTHDLRAPIASTLGLLSLSKTDKSNIEYYQELQEKSLHKLDFFINDVLQYAKNKRMEVLISEIQLPSLITEVEHALANEGVYPKIKVEVDY